MRITRILINYAGGLHWRGPGSYPYIAAGAIGAILTSSLIFCGPRRSYCIGIGVG